MPDPYIANVHKALMEISIELNMLANELVETNQKLHVIVTNLSSYERQQSPDKPSSPRSGE